MDIGYNLLNANSPMAYEETYLGADNGATWLRPTSFTAPRLARFKRHDDHLILDSRTGRDR